MTGVGESDGDPAGVTRPRILPARVPAGQHGTVRLDGQPKVEQGPGGHGPLSGGGAGDQPRPQPVTAGPVGGRDTGRLGPGQRGWPSRRRVDSSGRAQDAGVGLELAGQLGRNRQLPLRLAWVLSDTGDRELRLRRPPGRPGDHRGTHRGRGDRQHQGGTGHRGPLRGGTDSVSEGHRRRLTPEPPAAR